LAAGEQAREFRLNFKKRANPASETAAFENCLAFVEFSGSKGAQPQKNAP
jgi:hypothetical protein